MVDEGIPFDDEQIVDEGIPFEGEQIVDEGIPFEDEQIVDEGIPFEGEQIVDEGIPFDDEHQKKTLVDEGIPMYADTNEFYMTEKKKLRNGIAVILSFLRNTTKLNLVLLITTMTVTSTYALESNSLLIVSISTPAFLNQPFNITVNLKNTTCGDHLHWLQVSDQFNVNIIARGTLSYNESVYNIFLDYSEMCLNYTLQIKKVTFEDFKKEYRVECGRKTIPIKLLQDHEVILQPETVQKKFSIENDYLIGTVVLVNMYPKPTRYCITLQKSDGRNITFDRPFLNGSDNNVPNLINETLNVRETIEKNICSGILSVTFFVGDRVISTFSYQILSNCSTGMNNEVHNSPTIIIIITVVSVLGAVVIIVLGCMFKHRLKPYIKQIWNCFLVTGTHRGTTEDVDSVLDEQESFLQM